MYLLKNKRIFISIPWFTPAFRGGGPIQSVLNMVEQLQAEFAFFIFTADADHDGTPLTGIARNEWTAFGSSARVFYSTKQHRAKVLLREMKNVNPDKVYVVGMFDLLFNIYPVLFSPYPVIISVRGMLHSRALMYKPLKKKFFLSLFKLLRLPGKCRFHATDDFEAGEVRKAVGNSAKVYVAGNFPRQIPYSEKQKLPGRLDVITVALIGPMKNHLEVIKALKFVEENVTYHIYGPVKEPWYWQECRKAITQISAKTQVIYHGEIYPGDVPKALAKADVFIMPSKTENFGHSIVEALYSGLPVITSKNVPWLNLEADFAGINSDVASGALAAAIHLFAQMSDETFQKWKCGARIYAEKHIDMDELKVEYHQLFN